MIVDTSALMAIILREPEEALFLATVLRADERSVAAGTWVEIGAVLTRSHRQHLLMKLDSLMVSLRIEILPASVNQAQLAHAAYRIYGIGTGHPACLNFGDCFAYALSRETGRPLLFKGDDFGHTDVAVAL